MKTKKSRSALRWAKIVVIGIGFACLIHAAAPATTQKIEEKDALPYRIAHNDRLAVSVFGEQDLTSGGNKVEARGTITLSLIQEIRVAGLTVLEAQTAIENAYREGRFLRNPQVKVTVEEYAPRFVNVSGKVNSQGRKDLPAGRKMTLKELILAAGGFAETAKGTDVRITRTMPDGSTKTFRKDVQSALLGKDTSTVNDANFELEPDDNVYVPEKMF